MIKSIKGLNLKNKSVLLRIDINSPIVERRVLDNPRFEASARTIRYLIGKNAKITIIAHQGRKGGSDFLPLKQHAKILSKYTRKNIKYIDDLFGEKAKSAICSLKQGETILLKNVRSFKDEENLNQSNYKEFCKLFDIYINEAFSVSHRAQGSLVLPPKYLESYFGLEFEKELKALDKLVKSKASSRIFILGGSKTEDYFPIFQFLKNKNNKVLAAGILANLFLIAKGYNLGYENKWLKEHGYFPLLPKLKRIYQKNKEQIILPVDFGVGVNKIRLNRDLEEAPFKYKIYDIGKRTIELFKENIKEADSIFMKGPLGFSEIPIFSTGTREILACLAQKKHALTILGGGHLTTTIKKYKIKGHFSYISLSGGALIKYISGEKLPGIEAIKN